MAAEQPKDVPTDPASSPAPVTGDEAAAPSKKGAKKAEAKAKKEAEKARKAAEREAAAAATSSGPVEDLAKDNYGEVSKDKKIESAIVNLRNVGEEHVGKSIKLRAWIQNARMQGAKMAFVELREERNWTIQGVVSASAEGEPVSRQMVKWIGGLKLESFVSVEAMVMKPLEPVKSCKVSGFELHLTKVYLVAPAPEMLGLGMGAASRAVGNLDDETASDAPAVEGLSISDGAPVASLATHLNNPAMHKRAPVNQAIADIRIAVEDLFCDYLRARRFKRFHPPSLIGAASEGGANVFTLPYFDKQAYLAQSPQFYKQIEIAGGRKRVFCVHPVFRAENSNSPRHMTEFMGLDMEMEIEDHYHEVMHMLEGVLIYIFGKLATEYREEIELIRSVYPSEEFLLPEPGKEVRLTFAEGQALLRAEGPPEYANVSDDEDMTTAQEKALGALIRKKYHSDFYVLDKFPVEARPFYAMPDPENPQVTNAYDFMMRGQEILSGGQRLHLPHELEATIRSKGLDPNQPGLKGYVDVFKSVGVPPHGGGGIGLDRVVAWYLNLPSVQLVADYPRTPKRLAP
ncbi:aspartyl-tRNA synthetase-like protein [Amylocarpus encephaloides]|uniref:Aspartate--tRNA ligase, cytoplasmic n=1 Tax=Amylocarpus encephaloides TaxID=45428 RepID=A0A9P7YAS4_9HELO|nr:aspartyl-tRNA synthetase-like protein [Amylocarpus encephaloides]